MAMSTRLLVASLLALVVGGCSAGDAPLDSSRDSLERPGAEAEFEAPPAGMEVIRTFRFDEREQATAAEIAQAKIERAQDVCGPCRSRACRMLCILGEDYERVAERPQGDGDDCLMCGRETGFLPRPRLRHEVLDADTVVFSWDHVEGAGEYVLSGVRWRGVGPMTSAESLEWRVEDLSVEVTLQTNAGYTFSLTAYSEDGERRSLPSEPVDIEL